MSEVYSFVLLSGFNLDMSEVYSFVLLSGFRDQGFRVGSV